MPEGAVNEIAEGELARADFLLGGGERVVGDDDFLGRDGQGRRLEESFSLQRAVGLADPTAGEAELGFGVVVTLVVYALGVCLYVAAQTLFWLGVEDQPQGGEIVRSHGHHVTTGQVVVEVDVVHACSPPWYFGDGRDMFHVGRVEQGAEEGECGEKAVVESFKEDWGVWLGQFR